MPISTVLILKYVQQCYELSSRLFSALAKCRLFPQTTQTVNILDLLVPAMS